MKPITAFVFSMLIMPFSVMGQTELSILDIREHIEVESTSVSLCDLVDAPDRLPEELKKSEILTLPISEQRQQVSLVDLAYKLQRYPALLNYHLRGPDYVFIERTSADDGVEQPPESLVNVQAPAKEDLTQEPAAIVAEQRSTVENIAEASDDTVSERALMNEFLNQTKQRIAEHIQKSEPWASWKIDIAFSLKDDRRLQAVRPYDHLTLQPLEPFMKLGQVTFRVTFFDGHGTLISESNIAPGIWRKLNVVRLGDSLKIGHLLSAEDLCESPVWVRDEHLGFVTDIDDCIGLELTCDLNSGEILQERHMRDALWEEQLEWLNAVASRQAFLVKAKSTMGADDILSLAGNVK